MGKFCLDVTARSGGGFDVAWQQKVIRQLSTFDPAPISCEFFHLDGTASITFLLDANTNFDANQLAVELIDKLKPFMEGIGSGVARFRVSTVEDPHERGY